VIAAGSRPIARISVARARAASGEAGSLKLKSQAPSFSTWTRAAGSPTAPAPLGAASTARATRLVAPRKVQIVGS
jgi:hypothetical protein